MKKIKLNIIFTFVLALLFIPSVVKAASFSVKSSSYNATVGSTVTVSVTGTDLAGKFSVTSSDSSIISGGGNIWIDKDTQSVKFTVKAAGSVVITVKPVDVSDYSGNKITGSKTIIVQSYIPRALSSDNYLSSLSVNGAELIPSFDKDTDSYIVDLEPGTTSITVNAEKANKYASVSGTGKINVQEGTNNISVVVTAENGSKRTYRISAIVKDYDPINVKIDNSDFTVVRKRDELEAPAFYEETTVEIDGNTIPAFYNGQTGYTLVGLKDVTGTVKLYIYNNNNTYNNYLALSFSQMNLVIAGTPTNIPKGFIQDTITIDNEKIICYVNKELGITLIYGKSIVTGKEDFYTFENTDYTIQKFNIDSYDKLNEKLELYTYIIIGLGGLISLMIVGMIIAKIKNKNNLKHQKIELERTMNVDITQIQKEAKDTKKKSKLEKEKEEAIKKAEEDKKRVEEKEKKKLEKQSKKNKKDDDMFYL